jgi:hypothetical protein
MSDPSGLEKRRPMCFLRGNKVGFVATGDTASMVPVRRVWLQGFLGQYADKMRGPGGLEPDVDRRLPSLGLWTIFGSETASFTHQ